MKVAFVHDWLSTYTGAERVLESALELFPDAPVYTLIYQEDNFKHSPIASHAIHTSMIEQLPWGRTKYRTYLILMPLAVEQFDLSDYDVIISSSHAVAKGVLTGPDQLHLCICYSPMRYAWDLQHQYLKQAGLERGLRGWIAKWTLHQARLWDHRTANGVDQFLAISNFIARRIWKVYRRPSKVIYPPVNTGFFSLEEEKEDFYLTVSRMVPYKKVDLIVEAFSRMPDKKLVVIGDGPERDKVTRHASANIEILGYQTTGEIRDYMQRATAFVFAAEEDFGIAPLEAQACGTPVIAYGKGGVQETIQNLDSDQPTGVLFNQQTIEKVIDAVNQFESERNHISPQACRDNALRFSPDRFRQEFADFVEQGWAQYQQPNIDEQRNESLV